MLRQGRPFAAWAYFEAAAAARPDSAEAVFNRAKMRLALGDGWALPALRALASHVLYSTINFTEPPLPLPVWTQPIKEKVFFWGEQGIGDDVWFAGRLDDFVAAGAGVFWCSPKLAALIARSFPHITVGRAASRSGFNDFDYQLPIGHCPGVPSTRRVTPAAICA